MIEEVLYPGIVCVIWRRRKFLTQHTPACIITEQLTAPVAVIKWRISNDVICLQVFMHIIQKRTFVVTLYVAAVDMTDSKVHLGQSPGGLIALLPVNGNAVCR